MAYRNRVFVSFDGDTDMTYYNLMRAWKQNPNVPFSFSDAHDVNTALDTSQEETIKRRLRERIQNTKVFVSLIGRSYKYLYKFVRWEIEQALSLGLPMIAVNLNGLRQYDENLCPPVMRDQLVIHISFNAAILQFALENWPSRHHDLRRQGETGPRYYKDTVYSSLGL